ncbi:General transcription factor II-I repeat domain-containing protein 2-like [Oopsacas minuta]|uniref:General transcription factor II-I repeat domain-containing protein 2-like n=1 Tax=Oopsacas minuta TaxID=111878 RepID=A0AAV7KM79_9METZ|nr:General transcription factor II-I repeat domain-containing protein 2-like [Oopsacas minuta]
MFSCYIVLQKIVEKCKPFSDGEFIKECMVACAMKLCPKEKQKFEDVSLSRQKVILRIVDMAGGSTEQLTIVGKKFEYFSLALDESTDISGTSQLLIFVHGVNDDLQ